MASRAYLDLLFGVKFRA